MSKWRGDGGKECEAVGERVDGRKETELLEG